MNPNPEIYNAINVPNGLKCFYSGECHVCKKQNPIPKDVNFEGPTVSIPILTTINGVSKLVSKSSKNANGIVIPLNPSSSANDVSNGCVVTDTWGIMKTCKDTIKSASKRYNECQTCGKIFLCGAFRSSLFTFTEILHR